MENILESSRKIQVSPHNLKPDVLLDIALENSKFNDLGSMMLNFVRLNVKNPELIIHRLPSQSSGFKCVKNGIVERVDTTKEPHGIHCQNDAHRGSHNNVKTNGLECGGCVDHGPPMKSNHDVWSMPPLKPLETTSPILMIVLVSRSSSGKRIRKKLFRHLRTFVIENKQRIFDYLKNKTGREYEIHIIEECGQNGSLLAQWSDCIHHVRGEGKGLHMPASHMKDLFVFHMNRDMQFAYVANFPSDLTGKLSNHAQNLKDLKRFGIDSEKVHYICFGVGYGNSGVKKDFTIFSGDELLEKCQIYMINTSVGIPDSEEPLTRVVSGRVERAEMSLVDVIGK